jgi:transcription-repair coupling factor (superfamily II helicase)
VERSTSDDLLERVARSEPTARKLAQISASSWPVKFSHVTEPAQAFLIAALACVWHGFRAEDYRQHRHARTIWVLCPTVHAQELFYESLLIWMPTALFLPEAELTPVENVLPDPEITAERLALLSLIEGEHGATVVVTTRASLQHSAPKPGALATASMPLKRGIVQSMDELLNQLTRAGYEHVPQVTTRGHFAVRGGIVDLYSWQSALPVRVEFSGDTIESLREFDIDTQTSVRELSAVDILLGAPEEQTGQIADYIAADHIKIDIEPEADSSAQIQISEGWIEEGVEDFSGAFQDCELGEFALGDFVLAEAKRAQFVARLEQWRSRGAKVVIYFQTEGEIERFRELMGGENAVLTNVHLVQGTLAHGFCFPAANLVVLSAAELFGRFAAHTRRHLRRAERHRAQIDFSELAEGDLIVHLEHGVGRFLGLQRFVVGRAHRLSDADGGKTASGAPALQNQQQPQEVLVLEFADEAKLYVPLEQAYLVSRYVGVGKKSPSLSSLGDTKWARAKKNAAASIFDYAGKMLAVQAERETSPGHAFGPDTKWQTEFEHSFPFRETPDQLKAILETKIDMEKPRPMDRLICGDVGFGKTEVAIRAAFKAVIAGKQVAVLAPTTVLAQQHFEVFRQRMLDYPVRIEMLSRFRTQSEQNKILQLLRKGGVDIVIGTHRLISGDVTFKDLGLVVIDEEQRFGVLHKEKFKELFKLVDVLTLSATPIPRTLYLSLVGVKDMSTIETPPLNRLPIETVVCGYDERIIRDAIKREVERQGQVFFLHNRVQTIERARDRIVDLCPEARVEIGHGQMGADQLEAVMARFVVGKTDVLVCTTII